jgi:RNA polymerase sigma-70 factor, ECF subfamily
MNDESKPVNPATGEQGCSGVGPVPSSEITRLLAAWCQGDQGALDKLAPLVYGELQRVAHRYMEGQPAGHTLQTTALVNEAYLRLGGQEKPNFTNRSHFLAVAAKAMRQILIDHARASQRQKRGAGSSAVDLDEAALILPQPSRDVLDLNEAMERLAKLDARKAKVVELRYFGGLKHEEIAEVLEISTVTVQRDWVFSRAWLYSELHNGGH